MCSGAATFGAVPTRCLTGSRTIGFDLRLVISSPTNFWPHARGRRRLVVGSPALQSRWCRPLLGRPQARLPGVSCSPRVLISRSQGRHPADHHVELRGDKSLRGTERVSRRRGWSSGARFARAPPRAAGRYMGPSGVDEIECNTAQSRGIRQKVRSGPRLLEAVQVASEYHAIFFHER
jgi:hypothetical protein